MKRIKLLIILSLLILGFSNSAQAQELQKVRLGYFPFLYSTPLYVILEEGWHTEAGLEIELTRFNSLSYLQALTSGEVDGTGAVPAAGLILAQKNVPVNTVATFTSYLNGLLAIPPLTTDVNEYGIVEALKGFEKRHGRKPKISTNARGSQIDVSFRYWLKRNDVPEKAIEFIPANLDQMQQLIMAGRADGVMLPPPIPAVLQDRNKAAEVILQESLMVSGHGGLTLIFRQEFIDAHQGAVRIMVELIDRAVHFIHQNPDIAALYAQKYVSNGLVEQKIITRSLEDNIHIFSNNPIDSLEFAKKFERIYREAGYLEKPVDVDATYDLRFYNSLENTHDKN